MSEALIKRACQRAAAAPQLRITIFILKVLPIIKVVLFTRHVCGPAFVKKGLNNFQIVPA